MKGTLSYYFCFLFCYHFWQFIKNNNIELRIYGAAVTVACKSAILRSEPR